MDWDRFKWRCGIKKLILNSVDFSVAPDLVYKFDCEITAKLENGVKIIEFYPRFITRHRTTNAVLTDFTAVVTGEIDERDATIKNVSRFILSGLNKSFDLYAEECKRKYSGKHLYFPLPSEATIMQLIIRQKIANN